MRAPVLGLALIATALVAGCGVSRIAGPSDPPPTALPSNYLVELDSLFQTPRWVRNVDAGGAARTGAPAPFSDRFAFEVVRGFVLRYAAVFRLRPGVDDFVATWAQGRDGFNAVKIQQTYRGLPVDAMGYGTTVLPGGAVGSMIGRFMPGIAVPTAPVVSGPTAAARAIEALAPTVVYVLTPPTLRIAIVTEDFEPHLAWSVVVAHQGSWASWTVTVDARSGVVLRVAQNWIEG